eukprot:Tamp_08465.p1 GENE.Tamp_08465~~Tamp_08465.p1  ORF type:complete len:333 (+),score=56.64 Tamp_08465:1010-2008(+)
MDSSASDDELALAITALTQRPMVEQVFHTTVPTISQQDVEGKNFLQALQDITRDGSEDILKNIVKKALKIFEEAGQNNGFIPAYLFGLGDECQEFCQNPNNEMQADHKWDGGVFMITLRACFHYLLTRQNSGGVAFRDHMMKLITLLSQQYQCVVEGHATKNEWLAARTYSKETSREAIRQESVMIQAQKPGSTVTEANKKARVGPAGLHRTAYGILFEFELDENMTIFCEKNTRQVDPKNCSSNLDVSTNVIIAFAKVLQGLEYKAGNDKKQARKRAGEHLQRCADHPGWSRNPHDHVQPNAVRPKTVKVVLANAPAVTGAPPPPAAIGNA